MLLCRLGSFSCRCWLICWCICDWRIIVNMWRMGGGGGRGVFVRNEFFVIC